MKKKFYLTRLIPVFLLLSQQLYAQKKLTVSGFVRDAASNEELIGVSIRVVETGSGVITNAYGFYSMSLPANNYTLSVSFIGYKTLTVSLDLNTSSQTLNLLLEEEIKQLENVEIIGDKEDQTVQSVSISRNTINVEQLKKLPALFGEPDIIKSVQMMPGVISAGEGTTGFFVRGGGADQNLILIDEAPVYDASHFFGLFSVFNADVIKNSELFKGGIPSQYGGRLSSILDVRTKDGNSKKFAGSASIGSLASKAMLEGPILKDKASFMVSGRRSYFDLFQRMASGPISENLFHFYDINAKINYKPTEKDRIFVASYLGRDVFKFSQGEFSWGNATATARWNHLYSDRTFSNSTFVFSNFDYKLEINEPTNGFIWRAGLQNYSVKQDVTHYINPQSILTMGAGVIYHRFTPAVITGKPNSVLMSFELDKQHALEYWAYLHHEWELSQRFAIQYGLRFSMFSNVGRSEIRVYEDPKDYINPRYTVRKYGSFQNIKTYSNLEPRLSFRYTLNEQSSIKGGYNRMVQYNHLLSNSTVPLPFNTWTPSSPYLLPQKADQLSVGYFKNLRNNRFEFSVEAYYKDMRNVTDFVDNASLLINSDVATTYRQGNSTSYGLEFFLQKKRGKLTGFVSYTLSRTTRKVPDVNSNRVFFANYDRPHSLNAVATYELDYRWSFGGGFTYATGRPVTLPVGRYQLEPDGLTMPYFTERNAYRLPDFHRLDLSATYKPSKNLKRKWKSEYVLSIYNLYNRKNPFTVYTRVVQDADGNVVDPNRREARMVYLFPIFPALTYNVKF